MSPDYLEGLIRYLLLAGAMEVDIGQIALELTPVEQESHMQVSIRIRRSLDLECQQKLPALSNDFARGPRRYHLEH